ncbi:uncharacterized protein LOC131663224 isoform X2 [Phymastichus coffea]|nr:uncharacterized protein LOC131663224 isoform X2 [Phymastichus coffea]XP_058789474.1 uncharacterized protein LOC131663224 isoform X2 [Phymastichus coffea]XP_058789475.1 uncharacterized protein LOC131663224 isoform X2 [Phymastichus coffea]XP_058789476.1 uncharacterized protein LOC131663224 isoform X2 [Phymastichus coffea]
MSRRNKSQMSRSFVKDGKKLCCFCGLPDDNELEFGKFYEYEGIVTHYYCLLLSSNMEQKGSDDQGILGFLGDDIQKEIRRGKRLVCSHCKKSGATLGCCNVKCKRIFHLPCGLKAGSLHQFFGEFRSYCINHRPIQNIDERVKNEVKNMVNILCYICYEDVEPFDTNNTLWAPCCKKNAWFHRKCVQQLAMSAGYFFKCPLCNNKREFQTAMLEYGIYIPRQDASWELVPNAFQELLYRHDRCDAEPCLCPKGRTYSTTSAKWELILCRLCGSQGIHVSCGQLKLTNPMWECQECMAITKKSSTAGATPNDSTTNSNNLTIPRANVTINISVTENENDSDSDISVGNDSPVVDGLDDISLNLPPIKLRPGPKSFKLKQVQKIKNNEADKKGIIISHKPVECISNESKDIKSSRIPINVSEDIICLDSDDELPEIVCESGMKGVNKNSMNQFIFATNASGSSSSSFSNSTPLVIRNKKYDKTPIDLVSPMRTNTPTAIQDTEESTCNFIITNVTSVPAEFFASVPDSPTKETVSELPSFSLAMPDVPNQLKRNHQEACDEEQEDNQAIIEASKRARLDSTIDLEPAKVDDKLAPPPNVLLLPENPIKAVPSTSLVEASYATITPENCHKDAGTGPTVASFNETSDHSAADGTRNVDQPDDSQPIHSETDTNATDPPDLAMCITNSTVSANGSSSFINGSSGNGGSSKSRSSSCDRSGLIPDFVRLRDLKFRISGNDLELAYRACKIQMKVNDMQHITSSSSDTYNAASVSSAGSNQNLSNEKSSKSFPLRSDDSNESSRVLRFRSRGPRSFIYEDDNTLLEYPTTQAQNNAGISKESLTRDKASVPRNHNDLKENWNPEMSDSPMSNQFISTTKDKNINSSEKSNKSDNDSVSTPKDNSIITSRSLRSKSSRLVRHFHSIQKVTSPVNGLVIEDSMKPKSNMYFSIFEKRNSKSTKSHINSNTVEEDKHLKNVNMNDLRFSLTGTVKDMRDYKTHDVDLFKVSIDLQKIKNLITDKPDLFVKTNGDEYKSMCVYKMGQKLQIELKSGKKKILTKSRSCECLADLAKHSLRSQSMKKCKSSDNLYYNNVHDSVILTDKKDCEEKKVKSQRRKTRQFEKNECVR